MTYRIVTVCLGNICRSPMGEAVLRRYVDDAGTIDMTDVEDATSTAVPLRDLVCLDSAGTDGWHIGDRPDRRALATLRTHGYVLDHLGQQVDESWFARTDLFLAMDASNYARLMALAPTTAAAGKVRMMRSFDPALVGREPGDPDLDVPDPYYGDDDGFENVLEMLEKAAHGLVAALPALIRAQQHPSHAAPSSR